LKLSQLFYALKSSCLISHVNVETEGDSMVPFLKQSTSVAYWGLWSTGNLLTLITTYMQVFIITHGKKHAIIQTLI
jgi:hypothetical protein